MAITLNKNKVLTGIENMITMQTVFADNQKGSATLADKYRTEGSMLGDTLLFYAVDILKSFAFSPKGNDGSGGMDYNLLTEFLPKDPVVQKIVLDKARQIPFTVDNKFSKQAFITEGAFGSFWSVMYQQMGDTKLVYESGLINTFIGSVEGTAPAANQKVTLLAAGTSATAVEAEAVVRQNALMISNKIADVKTDLEDFSRAFNDYGFMRSYDFSDFDIIWNARYLNRIQTSALPVTYHNQGIVNPGIKPLPAKYFGTKLDKVTQEDTTTVVLIEELDYTVAGTKVHGLPGEKLTQGSYTAAELTALANKVLLPDDKIICKIVHKDAVKYMSGFLAATEFFNAQTLRTNSYLTWAYSDPAHLKNYPIITLKAA